MEAKEGGEDTQKVSDGEREKYVSESRKGENTEQWRERKRKIQICFLSVMISVRFQQYILVRHCEGIGI